jgi:hypothetical protein
MYAYNVTLEALQKSADRAGVKLEATEEPNRKRVRFTLKLAPDKKFQKVNFTPIWGSQRFTNFGMRFDWKTRRTVSVCFHGHYVFILDVLQNNPEALIESSRFGKVKYNQDNFLTLAEEYGDKPLGPEGNIYHGFRMRDTCECESHAL